MWLGQRRVLAWSSNGLDVVGVLAALGIVGLRRTLQRVKLHTRLRQLIFKGQSGGGCVDGSELRALVGDARNGVWSSAWRCNASEGLVVGTEPLCGGSWCLVQIV